MTWKLHTYDYWSTYLDGGRKKYMRPLYEYGMVIEKANHWQPAGSDLQIKARWAANLPFITVHNDDSFTLQGGTVNSFWGGNYDIIKSQGIRYRMWKYTGIRVFQKNYQIRVLELDPARTPSKIQGCRRCAQTGLVDGWCSPPTCYDGSRDDQGVFSCPTHPDATQTNGYRQWHQLPCSHGGIDGHSVKRGNTCYSCSGTGKREYGNNPISLPWDGSPLRVKDRKIVPITTSGLINLERLVAQYA